MNLEHLKGKTLLIVDDEEALREPLCMEFESLGCKVLEASNGKQAFEIVKREKIDAVVSDIRMPGGDGVELLKNIKEWNSEFPVVMLITGFSDLSREEAFDMGAESILTKPFDLDQIDAEVSRILTPIRDRLKGALSLSSNGATCHRTYKSIEASGKKGEFSLGRGGMFVAGTTDLPVSSEKVAIHIRFSEGNILSIEGSGVVRWVRREQVEDLLPGYGIEFESLSDGTRDEVLQIASDLKIKAFIPKT